MPLSPPEVAETDKGGVELVEGSASLFSEPRAEAALRPSTSAGCHHVALADGSNYLRWPGFFEFLISPDGCRIAGRPLGDASWEAFQTYLLGQVLSFALLQRGIEPLHATAVVVEGEAVALVGDCGNGKSSLAAAFLRAGYRLLTDDLLVLKEEGSGFLAYPSFPRIKLFPEIARALLGAPVHGAPLNPYTRKLIIPLGPEQSCQSPTPLTAVFVLRPLANGRHPRKVTVRKMSRRRAFLALTANTFNSRVTAPGRLKRLFTLAQRLTAVIPVKSLSYPRDLAVLPQVVQAILSARRKS